MLACERLRRKVRKVLLRRIRENMGNGAALTVKKSPVAGNLHVYVKSKKFRGMSAKERIDRVGDWLDEELPPSQAGRVTLMMLFTPAEERFFS